MKGATINTIKPLQTIICLLLAATSTVTILESTNPHNGPPQIYQSRLASIAQNTIRPIVLAPPSLGVSVRIVVSSSSSWMSGAAYDPATDTIYAAAYEGAGLTPTVYAISASSYHILSSIPLGVGNGYSLDMRMVINPKTNLVYVSSPNGISIINSTTNKLVSTIPAPFANGLSIDPLTNRIYMSRSDSDFVIVIDAATTKTLAGISVGSSPRGIAVASSMNKIFVVNYYSNTMSVIDGNANSVVATVPTGSGPSDVAISANSKLAYVSNSFNSFSISVFNTTSYEVVDTIYTPGVIPRGPSVVDSVRNLLYIASDPDTLDVVDMTDNSSDGITVCFPHGVAVNDATGSVYVSSVYQGSKGSVSVVESSSRASRLTLTASTGTSLVGFTVTATGTVTDWDVTSQRILPVQNTPVKLQFDILDGGSGQTVTVQTDSNGKFSAQWIPTLTGIYSITAYRSETCQQATVSISVLPVENPYIFSVASNSTISSLAFNSTSQLLSFQLSGTTGQAARVDVSIAKSLLSAIGSLRVLTNSLNTPFRYSDAGQSWIVTFTVRFASPAYIVMQLAGTPPGNMTSYQVYAVIAIAGIAAGSLVLYYRRKRKTITDNSDAMTPPVGSLKVGEFDLQ